MFYHKPSDAIKSTKEKLYYYGSEVKTERWQSIEIDRPMWELFGHSFGFEIPKSVEELKEEVRPNLPWADDHFEERVGGIPLNPPPSNEWWPFAQRGNQQFKKSEKFSHTYPERIWPDKHKGVRFEYGNLGDVVNLLREEPYTRQAFLPIWFPEDTGAVHRERVPCSIGYHFIRRADYLHVFYYIRSCDYIRHFRDDIYLACRKLMWIIDELKSETDVWKDVVPGSYNMFITSLHVFEQEKELLKQRRI